MSAQAVGEIKYLLVRDPILAYHHFDHDFILTTDSSTVVRGAIHRQKIRSRELVISFATKPLNKTEGNYSTTKQECLVVVPTEKYYTSRTNHDPLNYLRSVLNPYGRLAR